MVFNTHLNFLLCSCSLYKLIWHISVINCCHGFVFTLLRLLSGSLQFFLVRVVANIMLSKLTSHVCFVVFSILGGFHVILCTSGARKTQCRTKFAIFPYCVSEMSCDDDEMQWLGYSNNFKILVLCILLG